MRRSSSFVMWSVVCVLCLFPLSAALANVDGSVADSSQWGVTSYQVKLMDHRGGSGDIQTDQNGWIYLGANHLEGGDIKYDVDVGYLTQADIIEVWIDGYSTSTALDVGPTVFIGTGKNRYEQITRITGDAWRPFVFRFADDTMYGDVTDPSNRNANWRTRYPSSKYEIRRIDKSPSALLDNRTLPIRVSVTGADDFIVKRIEVVVYRSRPVSYTRGGLYIVSVNPSTVRHGQQVTVKLNQDVPTAGVDFYLIDPTGREYALPMRSSKAGSANIVFFADDYLFPRSGEYKVKVVDRRNPGDKREDIERFRFAAVTRKIVEKPKPQPTPPISTPEVECGPAFAGSECLPPVPAMPSIPGPYAAPGPAPSVPVMPGAPGPYAAPGPAPYGTMPYVVPAPAPPPMVSAPQMYGGYTIQIAALRSQSSAVTMRDKLLRSGFDAYISDATQGGKHLFRVRVGRYPDKSLALHEAQRLRSSGFDTWVTNL